MLTDGRTDRPSYRDARTHLKGGKNDRQRKEREKKTRARKTKKKQKQKKKKTKKEDIP